MLLTSNNPATNVAKHCLSIVLYVLGLITNNYDAYVKVVRMLLGAPEGIVRVCDQYKELVVYCATLALMCYAAKQALRMTFVRRWWIHTRTLLESNIISLFSGALQFDERQRFKDCIARLKLLHRSPRQHSHPEAAQQRCIGNVSMKSFINALGKTQYSVSMSKPEQSAGTDGTRLYYHAKDLQMHNQGTKFNPAKHIVTMTDVDYYYDMPSLMDGRMIVLYTVVPQAPAGRVPNGCYSTDEQGRMVTVVNGGAVYRHHLWDYNTDHLCVDHWWGTSFYLLEQIQCVGQRQLILLNPVRNVFGPLAWIISGKRLETRNDVCGRTAISCYTVQAGGGDLKIKYGIAEVNQAIAAELDQECYHSAIVRLGEHKNPHLTDLERIFNAFAVCGEDSCARLASASIVYACYMRGELERSGLPVRTGAVDLHTYQTTRGLVTEDGKPSMRAIWPGFSKSGAFAPAKSYNNDLATISGRIDEPRNDQRELHPMIEFYREEFIKFLIPESKAHTLTPQDHEFMLTRFSRATQRTLIERVENCIVATRTYVRSFMKPEAYAKIAAPRNISTVDMAHNFVLGQFTYPFSESVLKNTHWYAFGKHPRVLSQLLHEKARGKQTAISTDANKMDGSLHGFFRDLMVACMTRAFVPLYGQEINTLENKERYVDAKTSFNVKYNTGTSTLSGSSDTSILNSLCNGFINYCAYRVSFGATESWQRLGLYGGDDGVSYDLDPTHLVQTAARFGMVFEAGLIASGRPVPFLGRLYVDPWTTDASVMDVARQARKLHLTATPATVSEILVLNRKAVGILVTDPDTPFISAWAKAVVRLTNNHPAVNPNKFKLTRCDDRYWAKFESPFIQPSTRSLAMSVVTENLEMSSGDITRFEIACDRARYLDDLKMEDVLVFSSTPTVTAVVNGTMRHAPKRTTLPEQLVKNLPAKSDVPCKWNRNCKSPGCKFQHGPVTIKPRHRVKV